MDFSVASEYENISGIQDFSASVLYQAVNNVLSVTTINGNKIFCPLCAKAFEFKFALQDHLKNIHYHFLRRTTEKTFTHEQCPFCYANFFGRHTVIKHVLQTHSKLIAQLYLKESKYSDSELHLCFFCSEHYNRRIAVEFTSHIEQKHFLQFTKLFEKQFIKANDSVLSPKTDTLMPQSTSNEGLSAGSETDNQSNFDFSHLKEQLFHIECNTSDLKSILKSNRTKMDVPCASKKTSVCRVLQFDLPDEDKENIVLTQNIKSEKNLTIAEHKLLCNSKAKEVFKDATGHFTAGIEPIDCSTPKYKSCTNCIKTPGKKVQSQLKRKLKVKKKATFKSYFFNKDYVFQCGKCKKLFQENIELNAHIKKSHKLFILNLLHPCYQCAICEIKFFKNYYLRKHVMLHTGYKE